MSTIGNLIRGLFTSRFASSTKADGTTSNLSVIVDAVGTTLDGLDPAQTNLASQFAVSTATGKALDQNGADWGVTRGVGESDSAYRARILSVIPTYAQGPTIPALSAAVQPFTGAAPTISQRSQNIATFPLTFPINFGCGSLEDNFVIDLHVQNPNGVTYDHNALIAAVRASKRAVATVYVWWDPIWSMSTMAGYMAPQNPPYTIVQ